jgi:hypothetical protein
MLTESIGPITKALIAEYINNAIKCSLYDFFAEKQLNREFHNRTVVRELDKM